MPQRGEVQRSTQLVTLGTAGGPVPRADRAQSANLLIVNGVPYLVDAGDGVTRRLAEAGVNFRDLGSDFHYSAVTTIIRRVLVRCCLLQWDPPTHQTNQRLWPSPAQKRWSKRPCSISPSSWRDQDQSTGARTVPIAQVFFGHDVGTCVVYQDANVKVTAVENSHFLFSLKAASAYGKHKSYAYRFDTLDRVIVFTGDTGPNDAVTELASRG